MRKLNIKKYLSLGNIVCMIDDGVLSFIENSIRKETIESKINYLINSFSNKIIMSSKLYKKIEDGIWEIRHHDIRIFCYKENNNWFLYHAMIKKSDKIGDEIYIVRKKYNELKMIIN